MFKFVNYKVTKVKHEELTEIKLLEFEDVYVSLPWGLVDANNIPEHPVIFGDVDGMPRIMDAMYVLEKTRVFHFKEGAEDERTKQKSVVECEPNDKDVKFHFRLPKDTPVEDLIFVNGQLLLAQKEPVKN